MLVKIRFSNGVNHWKTEHHWKREQTITIGIPNVFCISAPNVIFLDFQPSKPATNVIFLNFEPSKPATNVIFLDFQLSKPATNVRTANVVGASQKSESIEMIKVRNNVASQKSEPIEMIKVRNNAASQKSESIEMIKVRNNVQTDGVTFFLQQNSKVRFDLFHQIHANPVFWVPVSWGP